MQDRIGYIYILFKRIIAHLKNIKIVNKPFSSILPKKRGEEETIVFKQGLVVLDIVLNYIPSSKLTIFQKCLACVQ